MMIRREIQLHKQKPDLFITKRRGKPSPEEVNISVILPRICGRVKSSERLFQKCRKELTEHGAFAFPESRASERESARKSVVSHAKWKSGGSSGWRKRAPGKPRREDAHLAEQVKGAFQANRRVYGSPRVHAEWRAQGIHGAKAPGSSSDAGNLRLCASQGNLYHHHEERQSH